MSNSPDANSLAGKQLAGRFRLDNKIGQGGMGAVYRATHTQMGRTCAIKLLLPASTDAEQSVERFKREAQLASRIDNPHAVTIYDFGEADGGVLYLAMEFVEGRHLGRVMSDERPLATDRVVHIACQIAEALAAAHALGIVHRDLKPENVMVTRKGEDTDYVKVLDFGIAKTFDESGGENITKTGFVLGTPFYMSPEQLSGDKLDARSDVYSLALIVYEMISGRLPFEGDNSQAVMIKRLTSEPLPLSQIAPTVSPEVERVVMKALTRDRANRTSSALAFAEQLQSAVAGTQILSSRHTNRVAEEESGRSTIAIAETNTSAEPEPVAAVKPLPQSPSQSALPVDGAKETREETPGKSPSAYVTKPALDSPTPHQGQTGGEGTLPFGSEKSNPPPVGFQPPAIAPEHTRLSQPSPPATQLSANPFAQQTQVQSYQQSHQAAPYPPPPRPAATPAYGQVTPREPSKSRLGLALGALVVIVVVAVGAGLYFFTPLFRSPQPIVTTPPKKDPTELNPTVTKSDTEVATTHYENGKRHQNQANSLADAGSSSDAAAENQRAIEEYSKAITLKPDYPEAHENLGVAYYSVGNFDLAVAELKTAIDQYTQKRQRPTSQVMTNYGLALFDLKRYPEAADAFRQAHAIDSTDTDMLAFQGFALQNAGDKAGANAVYRTYLDAAPTGQYADAVRDILAGRAQPPSTTGN